MAMNKNLKKSLSLLTALVLVITTVACGLTALGDTYVEINAVNFPDPVFRRLVGEKYDLDEDGYLSQSERNVTLFSISGLVDPEEEAVESIQGIEFFPSVTILRVGGVGLTSIDVSSLTNLTSLTCQGNELETIDLGYNMQLTTLNCSDNRLTYLDLGSNARLTSVYCYANSITSLDFRGCQNITKLRCDQNELTYLDVSMLTKLAEFNCSKNHIPSLNLATTSLTEVTDYMIGNQTLELQATLDNDQIIIPFTNHGLTSGNYIGCTLDQYTGSGFEYDQFVANDVDEIADGITYYCDTGIAGSEAMSVDVTVLRDFYEVKFYQTEQHTILLGKSFVASGGSATAPQAMPVSCKAFDSWSEDITNVTEDMNVHALFVDAHTYTITAFDGEDTVTVSCSVCSDSRTLSFSEAISTQPNAPNYEPCLDLNNDNYINAKDYAILCSMFA